MDSSMASDENDAGWNSDDEDIEVEEKINEPVFEASQVDTDAILGMEFESLEDAEEFYSHYAFVMGFTFRRCSLGRGKEGIPIKREWECSCAGERRSRDCSTPRIRKETESFRCKCPGYFKVSLDPGTNKYKVTKFVALHNHAPKDPETMAKMKGSKFISDFQKSTMAQLQRAGVRPCQSIRFLEQLEGGGPGCFATRKKDFYNYLNKKRVDTKNAGDAQTALSLLQGMKIADPNLVVERTCDSDQTLTKLFWCDGFSRLAFDKFSDVLVVDSTYKTNTYRFPLVFLSGIDNHFKSTVFGSALLYNETTESYVWLFKTFREAMGGKAPAVILTDQDDAMRAAIQIVFPEAIHRLCGWHLNRNCIQKVKVDRFRKGFPKLMVNRCSEVEFEKAWAILIEETGLTQDPWVKEVYGKRQLWAEAYFLGRFMAKSRTTQRAESLNGVFKLFGSKGSTITEFFTHYFDVVREMRMKFREAQGDAEKSPSHVQTDAPLYLLQRDMATIYTPEIMKFIDKEISKEKNLIVADKHVVQRTGAVRFVFEKYGVGQKRKWSVLVDSEKHNFKCVCLMLEADGIPCRHIFGALKNLNIHSFPRGLVCDRWTTEYGSVLKQHCKVPNITLERESTRRKFRLSKECEDLCRKASQTDAQTDASIKRIRRHKAGIALDGKVDSASTYVGGAEDENENHAPDKLSQNTTRLLDPKRIQSRGAPKSQPQKCGRCGDAGHKSTTCQGKKGEQGRHSRKSGTKQHLEDDNISMSNNEGAVGS